MTIISDNSPDDGQSGHVRRVFWRERIPWVLVRLRIGGVIAVRWDCTDLPVPQLEERPSPNLVIPVLLCPRALLDIVRFLHSHYTESKNENHFHD